MPNIINIYCDESCHLKNDRQPVMVLGAVWCELDKTHEIAERLREIRMRHNMPKGFEIKWNKVSPAGKEFYLDVINYFFDDEHLHFRGWVAHKENLRHESFGQTHDDWYYKMMFGLLGPLLNPDHRFRIYLDKKDTRSASKVKKLHDVLCNTLYDFNHSILDRVQVVESKDVEQIQMADLLLGAISYVNRGLSGNAGKDALVERIRQRTHYSLLRKTLLGEAKFNLFIWNGQQKADAI